MDLIAFILTVVAGFIFGIFAVLVGIGGGLMNVPYLIYIIKLTTTATITSTFVILFTSSSGTQKYITEKRIDYRTGLIYLILALPGSILGRAFAQYIHNNVKIIKILFAILIGFTALINIIRIYRAKRAKKLTQNKSVEDSSKDYSAQMEEIKNQGPIKKKGRFVEKRKIVAKNGDVFEYEVKLGVGALFALLGGFIAGLLGVGGGIIFVPVMTSISGVPIHIAVATSTFMIVFVSIVTLITYIALGGNISAVLLWGIPLALGAVVGARIGAVRAKRIQSDNLLLLFWIVAILAAIRMGI